MALTPAEALADCEGYLARFGFHLDPDARTLIMSVESFAYQMGYSPYPEVTLCAMIQHFAPLRAAMLRHGFQPEDGVLALQQAIRDAGFDEYDPGGSPPYSDGSNRVDVRSGLIDSTLVAAQRKGSNTVTAYDIIAGFLDEHDDRCPVVDNASWTNTKLHVPYNTLSHVLGHFEPSLWIRFDVLREELGLQSPGVVRQAPIDAAPSRLKPAIMSFLADHPDFRTNCFLIMSFRQTEFHQTVEATLRRVMNQWGITVLRADDKLYTDDVLTNIETYMYGCRFGISLHERVLSNDHNANVAFEIGYMLGLKKHVCLLKEKTVERLPSDLQGRLYVEFDGFAVGATLEKALLKWLADKELLPHNTHF